MNKPGFRTVSSFNNLVNDLMENLKFPESFNYDGGNVLPAVNILENEHGFHLELSAPGFSKEEITLLVEKENLVISGEKKVEETTEEKNYHRREFTYNNFKRVFNLTEKVDKEKIEASFENGIVKIQLPKKTEEVASTIKIELK
jgi:HSP20 family protein